MRKYFGIETSAALHTLNEYRDSLKNLRLANVPGFKLRQVYLKRLPELPEYLQFALPLLPILVP